MFACRFSHAFAPAPPAPAGAADPAPPPPGMKWEVGVRHAGKQYKPSSKESLAWAELQARQAVSVREDLLVRVSDVEAGAGDRGDLLLGPRRRFSFPRAVTWSVGCVSASHTPRGIHTVCLHSLATRATCQSCSRSEEMTSGKRKKSEISLTRIGFVRNKLTMFQRHDCALHDGSKNEACLQLWFRTGVC